MLPSREGVEATYLGAAGVRDDASCPLGKKTVLTLELVAAKSRPPAPLRRRDTIR